MSTTTERVKKVVVERLQTNPELVTDNAAFIEDLGADSLDVVDLVIGFEDEFEISIPDEDAEKITRVGEAVAYVDSKLTA